ncbi:sec7 domain-containing protein [Cystoisospora suis]|uniref:Sec7 domain-containing protein n=1 Tax=Cystoisospora suis TaxID=483139 RepID=A0A2C6KJZ5_9APIC|nr:sec7 domain-containing protein [Cystoisospora suis]
MSGMRQLPGLLKQVREGIAATMSLLTSVFSRSSSANNTTAFSNPKHGSPSAHFPPAVVEDAFPGVPPDGARMKMVEAADRFIRVSRWLVAQYLSKERELRALRVVKEREQRQQDQQRTQQTRGAETGWAEPSKASCLHLLTQVETVYRKTRFTVPIHVCV